MDCVFGGPPCQGFSLIGHRAREDPRNSLVLEFVRIVAELGARTFVFENVKGLTIGRHKEFLRERPLISERTRAGAKTAQRRGVKFGRKVRLTPEQIDHARKLIEKGEARQYVAGLLNVVRSTLYRALNS